MVTEKGTIVIELYLATRRSPPANFLAYADKGLLDGGSFYRTVSPKNDNNPATISVIQGGLGTATTAPAGHRPRDDQGHRPEAHRRGDLDGAERAGLGGSEFFICLGDNPALDFGGARNKDGQGFAAFGGWWRAWTWSAPSTRQRRRRGATIPT
jgi:peptidyl-prolyl cis-trans isomerase A (cyclophilin A)